MSILKTIRKYCTVPEDDDCFDGELIILTNGVIFELEQLGVEPNGFVLSDDTQLWTEYIGTRTDLEVIKGYICISVKLTFDPPGNSFLITALQQQLDKYAWRIREHMEQQGGDVNGRRTSTSPVNEQ